MNKTEFGEHVANLTRRAEQDSTPPLLRIEEFLQDLLKTKAAWSADAMLSLIYGDRSEKLTSLVVLCLGVGCRPTWRGQLFAYEPFSQVCMEAGRHELLKTIAMRGVPLERLRHKGRGKEGMIARAAMASGATTVAGAALDLMSGTDGCPRAFTEVLSKHAQLKYHSIPLLDAGLKLLSELDPQHAGTARFTGLMSARYTAATMTATLNAQPAAVAAPRTAPSRLL